MKTNTALTVLSLRCDDRMNIKWSGWSKFVWAANKIGVEGAVMISEALKANTTLTELNLGCNDDNR